jgi:hypothetical protein
MRKLSLCLIATALLLGCKEDEPISTHDNVRTVEWYKSHTSERKTVLAECKDNPGELSLTPNCVNAKAADDATVFGSRKFGVDATAPTFEKKGQ